MPVLEDPGTYPASLKKAESTGATTLFMGHAFKGADGDLGPVATGSTVARVYRESLATHEAWDGAVRAALAELPGAKGVDVALRATSKLKEQLSLSDTDAGLPSSGTTTIPAYIRMARG
jgi:hypothetical protein